MIDLETIVGAHSVRPRLVVSTACIEVRRMLEHAGAHCAPLQVHSK